MSISKKEAIKAYKERKPHRGAYAIRCTATGQVWVGSTPNLDAKRNSVWFGLRLGNFIDKTLQAEWNTHREQAFEYEILETLEDELCDIEVSTRLKQVRTTWAARKGATTLL
jgi:hypothetical protein